jgi:hypothetical protein
MKKMSGWECPLSRTAAAKKSAAGEAGGGRTHTFAVRRAGAKLKTRAVYQRSDIVLSHGKPIPRNGNGEQA